MTAIAPAIAAEALVKKYRDKRALDGFNLVATAGTVHGLLGPNGAGKTTAVRILSTLLRFDAGAARVAGVDVRADPATVRRWIGLTGQHIAVDDDMTARENLILFGKLFHIGSAQAKRRADELLDRFGLIDVAGKRPKHFSGGMRRRLDLAASLIRAPKVLFLDEPTTGLDPVGRAEVWQAIRQLTAGGTTVLLTTHYLDEADKLCDRITVIDHGRAIVDDTPGGLKRAIGSDRLEVVAADPADLEVIAPVLATVASGEVTVDETGPLVHAPVTGGVAALTQVARTLEDKAIAVTDIGLRRPTLDEAFLQLTGQSTGWTGGSSTESEVDNR